MSVHDYLEFINRKAVIAPVRGIECAFEINASAFPYQRDVIEFLVRTGCGGAFLDTGLGKTLISLEYARIVHEHTNKPVLMLAPLAVNQQHVREAKKWGIQATAIRTPDQLTKGINIANYERLDLFRPEQFAGVVLDESSIIKGFNGATTRKLMAFAESLPFRLCATATPAPNDHMEMGQHSQFLGVMASHEMLSRWFITDPSEMGKYRLKKHGVKPFWSWVASWARCMSKPSDMGYSDEGFDLPDLIEHKHFVDSDITRGAADDALFRVPETSATSIHREKRISAPARAKRIADVIAGDPDEPWIIWAETNYETEELRKAIPQSFEVRGDMKPEMKEDLLLRFSDHGGILITKPSIAGFGLNWQHCARVAFVGLSFSFEQYYQAIRRCWRFGQKRPVQVHVAMSDTEYVIWQAVSRKADDHASMKDEMSDAMARAIDIRSVKHAYSPELKTRIPSWIK